MTRCGIRGAAGFTLLEVMLTLSLTTVIGGICVTTLSRYRAWTADHDRMHVQLREIERLAADLRRDASKSQSVTFRTDGFELSGADANIISRYKLDTADGYIDRGSERYAIDPSTRLSIAAHNELTTRLGVATYALRISNERSNLPALEILFTTPQS